MSARRTKSAVRPAARRILVVEDNPITRKIIAGILEENGYEVVEAGDGKGALKAASGRPFDLAILDIGLPDADGLELISRLRALPGGADAFYFACSSMLPHLPREKVAAAGFDELLPKPVDAATLLNAVCRRFRSTAAGARKKGRNRLILVVDDEPANRKTESLILEEHGFRVKTATDGATALRAARRMKPDAILSDIVMGAMDGFDFALAIRKEKSLITVPVVLITSSIDIDDRDRSLAAAVGASAIVPRTPGLPEAVTALFTALVSPGPKVAVAEVATGRRDFEYRLIRYLEHQVAIDAGLLRTTAQQSAQLVFLSGLIESVSASNDPGKILDDILVRLIVSTVATNGAAFLADQATGRLTPTAHYGLDNATAVEAARLLDRTPPSAKPIRLTAAYTGTKNATKLLSVFSASSLLILDITGAGQTRHGILLIASPNPRFAEEWVDVADIVRRETGLVLSRLKGEEELLRSRERYRSLLITAMDGFWRTNREGRLLEVNDAYCRMSGYSREELLRMHISDLETVESAADIGEHIRKIMTQGDDRFETRHRRKDGGVYDIEVSAQHRPLEGGQIVAFIRDISQMKLLQAQFLQSQKLEAIGRLAGGVAHDFNNILTVIASCVEVLEAECSRRSETHEELRGIRDAAERATTLTKQLLAFGRRQVVRSRVFSLVDTIKGMRGMLRRLIAENIELSFGWCATPSFVRADPRQIEQVITNLVVNARDAMPRGGRIAVNGACANAPPAGLPAGRYVALKISDTGTGIPADVREHIFEPFFTTKETGKGTGLGLSTVWGIVEQAGGTVTVESVLGKGSTFTVFLPQTDEAPDVEKKRANGKGKEKKTVCTDATILIVEDEAGVRRAACRILEREGFRVLGAESATAAVDLLKRLDAPPPPRSLGHGDAGDERPGTGDLPRARISDRPRHPHVRVRRGDGPERGDPARRRVPPEAVHQSNAPR